MCTTIPPVLQLQTSQTLFLIIWQSSIHSNRNVLFINLTSCCISELKMYHYFQYKHEWCISHIHWQQIPSFVFLKILHLSTSENYIARQVLVLAQWENETQMPGCRLVVDTWFKHLVIYSILALTLAQHNCPPSTWKRNILKSLMYVLIGSLLIINGLSPNYNRSFFGGVLKIQKIMLSWLNQEY